MAKQCNRCGAPVGMLDKYCDNCGNALNENTADFGSSYAEENVDVLIIPPKRGGSNPGADSREVRERLIGKKAEYYLPRFEQMESFNSFISWNWCAFLFSYLWMLYRKMYAFGIGLMVLSSVLTLTGLGGVGILVMIACGLCGNFLYMKDINNRTEKAMNMQPEQREAYIEKCGGTSWRPVIIYYVVSFILGFILGFLAI